MTSRPSSPAGGEGARSACGILEEVVRELGEFISQRGVRTEEMIRISGFFESAKALWLASSSPREPMPQSVFAHRIRVLVDICPPELQEMSERLQGALRMLEEAERRQKPA